MLKNIKKRTEGFTIVEVLIVLAIAGLILLIVFLAVPALQRNSRNTTIKNDAASALGAASDFVAANNGQMPTACPEAGGAGSGRFQMTGAGGTNPVDFNVKGGTVIQCFSSANPNITVLTKQSTGRLNVGLNWGCDGINPTAGTVPRSTAVAYLVETGTANTAVARQCSDG